MNFFTNYETKVLEELRVNVRKNFKYSEENTDGVKTVTEDYTAHYNEYRMILNSIWTNFHTIKNKYPDGQGITLGYIFDKELEEELLRRYIDEKAKQNESKS